MKKIILVASFFAVLFALYGLSGSLLKSAPEPKKTVQVAEVEPTITVWSLKHDVNKGQRVKRTDFVIEKMTESDALNLGIVDYNSISYQPNAVYRATQSENSIVFNGDIINPDQDGYVDAVIRPNFIPFAVNVAPESVVGGVINSNSLVDVLAVSLPTSYSMDTASSDAESKKNMYVTPILMGIPVLQVHKSVIEPTKNSPEQREINVILELTRQQVAQMTVATRISEISLHKSVGVYDKSELHADAGDVLENFKAVVEYRGRDVVVN